MVARFSPILLLFMFFTFPCSKSQDYVRTRDCGGRNFTQNSTYHSNVRTLLSSLSSNATRNFAGFFNTTVGRDPDKVYGLFQCRGDISEDDCANCVRQITGYALQDCPYTKDPCFWDVKCWLSYSDVNIFSLMRKDPFDFPKLTSNVTDQDRFVRELAASLKSVAADAAETTAVKKYATRQMNFTDFLTVYTLAQCTADMSHVDCSACLQGAIADLGDYMAGRRGGAILYPSCILRYELYQFYDAPSPSDSPVAASPGKNQRPIWKVIAIVASLSILLVLLLNAYYVLCRREKSKDHPNRKPIKGWTQVTVMEPLQYDFRVIKTATGNFSSNNLLGQGGFGDVYKGILGDGQEIAVKRLSRSSVQGTDEFKNEVRLLAKLQHRNLVRLFGFCLESDEKILIYEFVPNQSLDIFLFDPEKRKQLNWEKRYGLIGGIARGLLYLHEDSRLRIIHRDLKASNILLDIDMNPRISDFGIAKIVDQTFANTCRVVGTFGYIPPEFIIRGQFSLKSDVYSFGVLMLEIISGKKNYSFSETDPVDNLVSHAWKTWRNGTALELVDESVKKASHSEEEVMRCINIALLCVQEVPTDRPTMAMVVYMLNSGFGASLPSPQPPAFLFGIGTDNSQATSTTTATGHLLSTGSTSITPPSSEEGSRVEV